MKRICFQIVRVAGFVLLAALALCLIPLVIQPLVRDWARGQFVPEVMVYNKQRDERRRKWAYRRWHDIQMKKTKARKFDRNFYNTKKNRGRNKQS